jgi:hypothetical protein
LQDKDSLPRGQLASSFPEGVLFITHSLLVGLSVVLLHSA